MDAMWTQRVKYDLLNLKLAEKDMAKNRETLKKRYQTYCAANNCQTRMYFNTSWMLYRSD